MIYRSHSVYGHHIRSCWILWHLECFCDVHVIKSWQPQNVLLEDPIVVTGTIIILFELFNVDERNTHCSSLDHADPISWRIRWLSQWHNCSHIACQILIKIRYISATVHYHEYSFNENKYCHVHLSVSLGKHCIDILAILIWCQVELSFSHRSAVFSFYSVENGQIFLFHRPPVQCHSYIFRGIFRLNWLI